MGAPRELRGDRRNASEDLLRYPPTGYRAIERRGRIGHGDARFEFAWSETMSWGIQKRAGFRVELAHAPDGVSNQTYIPVSFDDFRHSDPRDDG